MANFKRLRKTGTQQAGAVSKGTRSKGAAVDRAAVEADARHSNAQMALVDQLHASMMNEEAMQQQQPDSFGQNSKQVAQTAEGGVTTPNFGSRVVVLNRKPPAIDRTAE